ncbi:MAG: 3'-5' exonuclease, partial [Candidatus Methanosuratincola sp.]
MPGLDSFIPDSQPNRRKPPRPSGGLSGIEGGPEPPRRRGGYPPGEEGDEFEREDLAEPEEEAEAEGLPGHEAEELEEVIAQTKFEADTPSETGSCVLLSVSYSGRRMRALAKLYDVERGRVVFWYDNTGHQPYLLTDMGLEELLSSEAASHPGFDPSGCREVEKHDLLQDRLVTMTKVAAKDPTSVGGRGTGIRDLLGERSWEDRIRYHECFVYDRRLVPGYYYRVKGGSLVPEAQEVPTDALKKAFPGATPAFLDSLTEWFPIFSSPVPEYRRVAIDIEVATEAQDRVPDPQVAANPVICVSAVGTDGRKQVLILRREGFEGEAGNAERPKELPEDASIVYFDREIDLIKEVFQILVEYPIVLTFNGDNFDLHYLWKRAQVLGMRKEEIPIVMGREIALLPVGVHIDLYKFFHNHAIQIYAFGNAYKELTLDAISEA